MKKQISRRDLLKAVIAGSGGFVATSFIPEKWLKPVVKSGVLPVHAQASTPTPTATPTQNYVKGFVEYPDSEVFFGFKMSALVSSTPFTDEVSKTTRNFKVASPTKKLINDFNPVEGEEVSLFIKLQESIDNEVIDSMEYFFVSTKTTDQYGYVEWDTDDLGGKDQKKDSVWKLSLWCKFEIQDDSDEVEFVLFDDGVTPEY